MQLRSRLCNKFIYIERQSLMRQGPMGAFVRPIGLS
jgi:hypothetical protein